MDFNPEGKSPEDLKLLVEEWFERKGCEKHPQLGFFREVSDCFITDTAARTRLSSLLPQPYKVHIGGECMFAVQIHKMIKESLPSLRWDYYHIKRISEAIGQYMVECGWW